MGQIQELKIYNKQYIFTTASKFLKTTFPTDESLVDNSCEFFYGTALDGNFPNFYVAEQQTSGCIKIYPDERTPSYANLTFIRSSKRITPLVAMDGREFKLQFDFYILPQLGTNQIIGVQGYKTWNNQTDGIAMGNIICYDFSTNKVYIYDATSAFPFAIPANAIFTSDELPSMAVNKLTVFTFVLYMCVDVVSGVSSLRLTILINGQVALVTARVKSSDYDFNSFTPFIAMSDCYPSEIGDLYLAGIGCGR